LVEIASVISSVETTTTFLSFKTTFLFDSWLRELHHDRFVTDSFATNGADSLLSLRDGTHLDECKGSFLCVLRNLEEKVIDCAHLLEVDSNIVFFGLSREIVTVLGMPTTNTRLEGSMKLSPPRAESCEEADRLLFLFCI
jgi:hypothetical protein